MNNGRPIRLETFVKLKSEFNFHDAKLIEKQKPICNREARNGQNRKQNRSSIFMLSEIIGTESNRHEMCNFLIKAAIGEEMNKKCGGVFFP